MPSTQNELSIALPEKLQHEIRKVDTSGRISLGREKVGTQYDVTEADDGSITLLPVTVIPTRELWLHRNPEAKDSVLPGLADSAAGRVSDGGDFTEKNPAQRMIGLFSSDEDAGVMDEVMDLIAESRETQTTREIGL